MIKLISVLIIIVSFSVAETDNPSRLGLSFNDCGYSGYRLKNDSTSLKIYKRCIGSNPNDIYDSTLVFKAVGGKIYLSKTKMDSIVRVRIDIDSVKRSSGD
jgi:hypothetical protein